ncbi:MAG: S1/P1 Nuclease, partial [Bryobacteraceae bacterium]
MENTVVQPWSWPCVLVFVKEWLKPAESHAAAVKSQIVPPFIYLPDGRVIPTCVMRASVWGGTDTRLVGYQFSRRLMGGGYPVVTQVQGSEHVGSVGCLVTDGTRHFALTNQHVAGDGGSEIFTLLQGDARRIGVSAKRSVRSKPFQDLYPGFPGAFTRSHLDVGLIEVDDLANWTARIFGLGVLGPLIEFNVHTASLDWIGTHAVAHGAHSGALKGEVKALFYRYRSLDGVDYVSDFLIGGIDGEALPTMPGDSGTLWCMETGTNVSKSYRPFALEWGGQKLNADGGAQFTQYALAASLAVACRELDVDIVTDLNAELPQYWGAVGHYKIAERAVDAAKGKLHSFLAKNMAQLTYPAAAINGGKIKPSPKGFVPLADVPDVVWKSNINRGGKAVRYQENWNHYADMDLPGA